MEHAIFVVLILVGLVALDLTALRFGRDTRRPVGGPDRRPDWW
jgi:hypothetical protein